MTDDQGWGDTGYNGHPVLKTPNLDAMARDGIRFDRFYAGAPVCSPTRGSAITGRHPYRYGIFYANVGHMKPEEVTLAEALKPLGYMTGHFGKWHLGTLTKTERDSNRGGPRGAAHYSPPWENGFDVCFSTEAKVPTWNPMVTPPGAGKRRAEGRPYGTAYWIGPGKKATKDLEGDDSRIIMDRVVPFIEKATAEGRPFLAVIWFHSPHRPVVAGPEYKRLYADRPKAEQNYYGCLTAMDEQVGRLRKTLARCGAAENTMLWFCSDNGPEGRAGKALKIEPGGSAIWKLRDAEGAVVRTWELPPVAAWWPTDRWVAGDRWAGRPVIRLPGDLGSGDYRLEVGMPSCASPLASVSIVVIAPDRVWQVPDGVQRVDVAFGGQVRLAGYAITTTSQKVRVRLVWQALDAMDASYRVFLHLQDAGGRVVGQSDGEPVDWLRPTTGWAVGEVVSEVREIALPPDTPPGEYIVRVGLYLPAGPRLLTNDSADAFVLGTVQIP